MNIDPIVIVSFARTPIGDFQGSLSALTSAELGAHAIKSVLARTKLDPNHIDEVIMGCVLQAGQGQAPARQAALGAKLPNATNCTTVNKMCGSAMKAIMLAHDQIKAGSHDIVIAGGMESMSNAPYLLSKARAGYRLGHGQIMDHMFLDGLEDAYDRGKLMGIFAEVTVEKYKFTREEQDKFAITSVERAKKAIETGCFEQEIEPITIQGKKDTVVVKIDESPGKAKLDKIPTLKPAFKKDGSVTAANSSSISDGAAAVMLMKESEAKKRNLPIIAKIVGFSSYSHEPCWFTTAPVGAVNKLSKKIGWAINDIDLFELNEAFAVVTMAAIKDLAISHDKVNIHGGACALGHPIGASGARIVCTLLAALKRYGKKRGIASLCIGGGEATAMAFEIV
jgi:acetyl-CoA C-acetyltransferase